jgi:hypothetical protein
MSSKTAASTGGYAPWLAGFVSLGISSFLLYLVELRELLLVLTVVLAVFLFALKAGLKALFLRDHYLDGGESFGLDFVTFIQLISVFCAVQYVIAIAFDLVKISHIQLPDLLLVLVVLIVAALSMLPFLQTTVFYSFFAADAYKEDENGEERTK